jgi:acetyl esterase/lipase
LARSRCEYAEKLAVSGVDVAHHHFAGQFHVFLIMGVNFPTTEKALTRSERRCSERCDNRRFLECAAAEAGL